MNPSFRFHHLEKERYAPNHAIERGIETHVTDNLYDTMYRHFSDDELEHLYPPNSFYIVTTREKNYQAYGKIEAPTGCILDYRETFYDFFLTPGIWISLTRIDELRNYEISMTLFITETRTNTKAQKPWYLVRLTTNQLGTSPGIEFIIDGQNSRVKMKTDDFPEFLTNVEKDFPFLSEFLQNKALTAQNVIEAAKLLRTYIILGTPYFPPTCL